MRTARKNCWFVTLAILCGGLLLPDTAAQETDKSKPFGSSLKRLKWDKKNETAVEQKPGKGQRKPATGDEDALKIKTALAVFDLLVADRQGHAVSGLTREDFLVSEDGVRQQVAAFALGNDAELPRSIVLVIDYSGSQIPYLQTSVAAAQNLVEQLKPKDKMAIITDDVKLLQGFTQDKAKLKTALGQLLRKALGKRLPGESKQFSALFAVLRELVAEQERPIILFQTDGDQYHRLQPQASNRSNKAPISPVNFGLADIIAAAQRERATIYSIISGIRLMGFSPAEQRERARRIQADFAASMAYLNMPWAGHMPVRKDQEVVDACLPRQEALAKLAAESGGWHEFLEQPEQAATIYTRILNDINRRYIIGYYPANEAQDGALRKVHFEIRGHPEYLIVGRRSYYASVP